MAFQTALLYRQFIFGGTSSQVGMKFKVSANLVPSWCEVQSSRGIVTGCNNFCPSQAEVSGKIIPNLGIIYEAKTSRQLVGKLRRHFVASCNKVCAKMCPKLGHIHPGSDQKFPTTCRGFLNGTRKSWAKLAQLLSPSVKTTSGQVVLKLRIREGGQLLLKLNRSEW